MSRRSAKHDRDEQDGGSRRTCIVTRETRAPDDMIRFVLDPQGRVTPDIRRKLPGRGVWVTAQAGLVAKSVTSRAFGRAFKSVAEADADLAARVDGLLERDALQALSLANKAGLVTTGAVKVEAAFAAEPIVALIQASDGSPDGARKLRQAAHRRWGEALAQLEWVDAYTSAQLDLALGRSNVIHAALKSGPVATTFIARWRRLAHYRGASGGKSVTATNATASAGSDGGGAAGPGETVGAASARGVYEDGRAQAPGTGYE